MQGQPLRARAHYQSVVSVNHNRYFYGYAINLNVLANTRAMDVKLDFLQPGDTVVLEFKNMPGGAKVATGGWTPAACLNDLMFGDGSRNLIQVASIFVKLKAVGESWLASDAVKIAL